MDDQKTIVVSVHAKDCVDYQCRRCGQCCRHIRDAVMVESLDAYRLAKYLRSREPNIYTIDEVLSQYCEPTPLTNDCFPIFVLKTTGPDDSCIFLKDGLCSIYEARPRTCRLYPFSVGPGERGRDFEYEDECAREDFLDKAQALPEYLALTEDQKKQLLHNADIKGRISHYLDLCDTYWECYWDAVSKAAQDILQDDQQASSQK